MFDIEQLITDYILMANTKIAQLNTAANDLLAKTGCNCDISSYLDDIADINSSLFIINKGWENIDPTFGYNNYLLSLFPEEDFDAAAAILQVIQTYINRYEMGSGQVMISPLYPSYGINSPYLSSFLDGLYYNKSESDLRFYPIGSNPDGYLTITDLSSYLTAAQVELLYYNKTESDSRFYPATSNPSGFISSETDPTVPSHVKLIEVADIQRWNNKLDSETDPTVPAYVKAISLSDISSWNNKLSSETDPTVPAHVKAITTVNINYWNSKLDTESDPTVPQFIKDITESDIDYWNNKITTETDPTVPSFVKSITNTNISNWNTAYSTSLTLTPLFIPRSSFTVLSFNRLGGYVIATQAQPLTSTNISLDIGGNISFSRSVIFHQGSSKPTFSGSGINVTEIGSYNQSQVNEIILFYNGSGRVIVIYTGQADSVGKSLITRGIISATSDTSVNISGFEWEIGGTPYSSGTVSGIPVSARPSSGIRVDSFWGDSLGGVVYVQGSDSLNEFFTENPDRVLLSVFVRKSDDYSHPSYIPIDQLASVGFAISRITSDSIGSITGVETRALSKVDVGLSNVDNTSDINKPVSLATQAAIDALDSRFIRKDQDDNNSTFKLTLGSLEVSGNVNVSGLGVDTSPVDALGLNSLGFIVRYSPVTVQDIIDLQDQIDALSAVEGDKNYAHIQAIASDTWTIAHNLNKRPAINVYDSDGNTVQYAADFPDNNTVILSFIGEISGRADLN